MKKGERVLWSHKVRYDPLLFGWPYGKQWATVLGFTAKRVKIETEDGDVRYVMRKNLAQAR